MTDAHTLAIAKSFNHEDRWRQGEVAKILRANFEVVWEGTYDHVAKQIVIALRTTTPPTPPPEFRFAEAFQSLTMRCLGYDEEIKALKRQVTALQGSVRELEQR